MTTNIKQIAKQTAAEFMDKNNSKCKCKNKNKKADMGGSK